MAMISDDALDAALAVIRTNATILHICSSEPANYAGVAAVSLGTKAAPVFSVAADRIGGGRETTVSAITDGSVSADGTATHIAIVDGTRLLAAEALAASQVVTNGNTFTLTSFTIGIPDPA